MEYKVWGKARAILKPQKHHYSYAAVWLFISAFVLAVGLAIHMAVLYMDSYYEGAREPYIQSLGSNNVIIRWQTVKRSQARIVLKDIKGKELFEQGEDFSSTAHNMQFSQLEPATRYYYSIFQDQKSYRSGDRYWFDTAPEKNSQQAVRILLTGNSGQSGKGLKAVKQAMTDWLRLHPRPGQRDLDMVISSGDNGDESGSNSGYQSGLFSEYQDLLKNVVYWPVYGEHDANGWSFFKIFSLPQYAESGGVASGTERYYSVDYGDVHLIFLDSQDGGYSADDAMINWLKNDLKNTQQKWLLAFMHHPPYSRGSHNSNDPRDGANRMFNMRKRVIPVLEQAGVDLVVSGYSHSYERSYLLDCHYGISSTLRSESIVQTGPVFYKNKIRAAHQGSIYTVIGSSAEAIRGKFDHPVMAVSEARLGSMIVDIDKDRLIGRFIDDQANVTDQFEINKVSGTTLPVIQKNSCQ